MTKFKVGDKVRVVNVDGILYGEKHYFNGFETEVIFIDTDGKVLLLDKNGEYGVYIIPLELAKGVIELIESKPRKKQRITVLEETVAKQSEAIEELKVIVHQLRKPSTVVQESLTAASSMEDIIEFEGAQYKKVDREAREGDVVIVKKSDSNNFAYIESAYIETQKPYMVSRDVTITDKDSSGYEGTFSVYAPEYGRTPETVDVYELIVEDKRPPIIFRQKTANEKRAEMIEKAKMFIEGNKNSNGYYSVYDDNDGIIFPQIPFLCKVEFIVNEEKRTVIALMRGFQSNRVLAKGIAKCMLDDVFNKYIGMAIALGRALGLDVSEFENAVQPTEIVIGQIVKSVLNGIGGVALKSDKENFSYDYAKRNDLTIINDTNAIY